MVNRGKAFFVAVACFGAAIGCGARTDTLFDDGGFGGTLGFGVGGQAHGGTSTTTAGTHGLGGTGNVGGFGTGNVGGFGTGNVGGFGTGNVGGFGTGNVGGFGTGNVGGFGTGNVGGFGTGNVGGFGTGGSTAAGGSTSSGGFGAIGGEAGAGATGGVVGLCVAAAQNGCDKCVCQRCGSELDTCANDFRCALLFACVVQTQCQGLDCYRASTCRPLIDQFGGLGSAPVSEVFSVASCSVTSRSGCGCN